MLSDFKKFVLRGNVVDLAVAVVVGVAFTAVVAAFVADFLTPLIGAIFGKSSFQNLYFTVHHSKFMYGDFLNKVLSFLIVATVVFFAVVVAADRADAAAEPRAQGRAPARDAAVPGVPERHPRGGPALRVLHLGGGAGRLGSLRGRRGALAGDLEAGDRAGHADVERRQRAVLGDGRHRITAPAHQRRQSLLLAAHHQGHGSFAQRQVVERLLDLPGQPDRPHAELAQLAQRGRHAARDGEEQVFDRPGGGLGDGR